MHTRTLKKLFLALTFWLALHTAALRADLLGPYGTSPITFDVDANGLLSDTGTYGGTGTLSLSGAGTRMFWYPQKAAFRAGGVSGSLWDNTNIGQYSTAFGLNNKASGWASTASGYLDTASQSGATALGISTTASGWSSTTLNYGTTASGWISVAMGGSSIASGTFSTASGCYSTASGYASIVMGHGDLATGNSSLASGNAARASGDYSAAFGNCTHNDSYNDFVVGSYNLNLGTSDTTWVATDPLFEIGNGTSTAYSDALVVYKNGTAAFQSTVSTHGTVRFNAGGDLSMGSFTAGTAP